jgi:hypothetical protein
MVSDIMIPVRGLLGLSVPAHDFSIAHEISFFNEQSGSLYLAAQSRKRVKSVQREMAILFMTDQYQVVTEWKGN